MTVVQSGNEWEALSGEPPGGGGGGRVEEKEERSVSSALILDPLWMGASRLDGC